MRNVRRSVAPIPDSSIRSMSIPVTGVVRPRRPLSAIGPSRGPLLTLPPSLPPSPPFANHLTFEMFLRTEQGTKNRRGRGMNPPMLLFRSLIFRINCIAVSRIGVRMHPLVSVSVLIGSYTCQYSVSARARARGRETRLQRND